MATRDEVHSPVDELSEGDLPRAKTALEAIVGVEVSEDERRELLERDAACDAGEVVDARAFLDELRTGATDSRR